MGGWGTRPFLHFSPFVVEGQEEGGLMLPFFFGIAVLPFHFTRTRCLVRCSTQERLLAPPVTLGS